MMKETARMATQEVSADRGLRPQRYGFCGRPKQMTYPLLSTISKARRPSLVSASGLCMGTAFRDELRIKRVRIRSVHVCIPGCPFMAGTIGLRMNLRRDGLQHDHDAVALHDAKE